MTHEHADRPEADALPPVPAGGPAEMSSGDPVSQPIDTALSRIAQDLERHLRVLLQDWQALAADDKRIAVENARRAFEGDIDRQVREAIERTTAQLAAEHQRQLDLIVAGHEERLQQLQREAEGFVRQVQSEGDARLAHASATWESTEAHIRAELTVAENQASEALEALAVTERSVRANEREMTVASLTRLIQAVERLDQCTSLKATLDQLGDCVACEALRSLILILRVDELRGWHVHGFDGAPDASSLSMNLVDAGELAEAARLGTPVPVSNETLAGLMTFTHRQADRPGLAVPVLLGHATVAIVYVDDGDSAEPNGQPGWREAVQLLARHASRHLEALTAARTARLSAQRTLEGPGTDGPALRLPQTNAAG